MHGREYALDARSRGRSWWAKAKRPDCLPHYPAPARVCASRPCLNTCARHKAVRQQDNSPNAHRRPRQHARTGIRPRRKVSGTILVEYSNNGPNLFPPTHKAVRQQVPVNMHGREYALDARSRGRSWWSTATTARISSPPTHARVCASRPCLNTGARHRRGRQQDNSPNADRLTPPGGRPACSGQRSEGAQRPSRRRKSTRRRPSARERSESNYTAAAFTA